MTDTRRTLSEYESKRLLARYGIPVVEERLCGTAEQACLAAGGLGFPVVVKACSPLGPTFTLSVTWVTRSWTKRSRFPFVSAGTRFVAFDRKRTKRPSSVCRSAP